MKEGLRALAKKWFKQAEYDLKDVEKALSWKSFNLCCFIRCFT